MILVLHNIRSVFNVASIFRTAECAGVKKIYLVGYTPAPLDRFGRVRGDFVKVSLGAEKLVNWEQVESIDELVLKLKKEKYKIVALEQDKQAIDYRTFRPSKKLALILGEETKGVPKKVLDKCDKVIEIPMRGRKESLNMSVAAGVAIFQLLN